MRTNSKGFTLIELLVVIAVIGILAVVVLASLSNAKSKGADAGSKRDLSTIRVQANLYYTSAGAGTYGAVTSACNLNMFLSDSTIAAAITHATNSSSAIACNVGPTNQIFAVAVTLKTSGTGYYCVDSNNTGKVIPTASVLGLSGSGDYALDTSTGLCGS